MSKHYNSNGVLIRKFNYKNVDEKKLRKPTNDEINSCFRTYEYLINNKIKLYNKIRTVILVILIIFSIATLTCLIPFKYEFIIGFIISIVMLILYLGMSKHINSETNFLNNIKEGSFKILDLKCGSDIKQEEAKKDNYSIYVDVYYLDDTLFCKNVKTVRGGLKKDSTMYLIYSEYKDGKNTKIKDDIVSSYMLSEEGYKNILVLDQSDTWINDPF